MSQEEAQSWDEIPTWPGWVLIGLTGVALIVVAGYLLLS